MKKIIYFLSCLCFLYSCQEKKTKQKYTAQLIKTSTVSIPINANIAPTYSEIQYLPEKNQVIIANRMGKKMLYKVDLDKEKIVEELPMDYSGPNNTGNNYRCFYYWNKDSIFLIGIYNQKFYLINEKGEIKNSYPLNIKTKGITMSTPEIMMGLHDATYSSETSTLSFMAFPANPSNLQSLSDDPVFFHLNLSDSTLSAGTPTYGLNYKKGVMEHPNNMSPFVTENNKKQLVFVFSTQPAIYVYDIASGAVEKHFFQSDYVDEYPRMQDLEEMTEYALESNEYERILFNANLGVYVLMVRLSTPYINENTGKKNTSNAKPISILVFNENFEKIAERKFEGNMYNVYNSFLTNEGLYLSIANPYNPNFTENELTYEVYEIVR